MKESIVLPPDAKESGIKVRPPQGCEIDEVKVVDGFLTVTFKEAKPKLPKSWDEFCENYPRKENEAFITNDSCIEVSGIERKFKLENQDKNLLPDRATAEAVLALCQLIQLRNCYNGDWVPDWTDWNENKYVIIFHKNNIAVESASLVAFSPLYFKTEELRDEFLRNFRDLIEKLKPLYGIKLDSQQ